MGVVRDDPAVMSRPTPVADRGIERRRLISIRDGGRSARRTVDGLARFVAAARDLQLGWGQFPDDAEVIYLYDKGDDCFGYALNLACDWSSEWGYAPFADAD
jgi:hypothetical protein